MKKELKDYIFDWNPITKVFTIADKRDVSGNDFVIMDKIRMISLLRFIIRVLAHLTVHGRKSISYKA
jgi:hypothetical protein